MTTSSTTNRVQITTGSTINITSLEIQSSDQVLITHTDASGDNTTYVLDTDYTINAGLDTVTLTSALTASEKATATLNVPVTQGTDFVNTAPLNSETIETALDKLTLINKQQNETISRALISSIDSNATFELPSLGGNANKYLKANSGESGLEFDTISTTGLATIVEDTTPQLGGNLDLNGNSILIPDGDSLKDDSSNEYIKFSKATSAVNELTVGNSATGSGPTISATGDDTNIDINIATKGTGDLNITGDVEVTGDLTVSGALVADGLSYPTSDGTAGQFIKTDGSGTLSFATQTAPAMEFISSTTASSASTVNIELTGSYYKYVIEFSDVIPGTDTTELYVRTSQDGGSSFDSGSGNYKWSFYSIEDGPTGTANSSGSDTEITLMDPPVRMGTGTGERVDGSITIRNPSASTYTIIQSDLVGMDSDANIFRIIGAGVRLEADVVTDIQFLASSGNINGTFKLYGINGS